MDPPVAPPPRQRYITSQAHFYQRKAEKEAAAFSAMVPGNFADFPTSPTDQYVLVDQMVAAMKDTTDILDNPDNNAHINCIRAKTDEELEEEAWEAMFDAYDAQRGKRIHKLLTAYFPNFMDRWEALVALMRHSKAAVADLFAIPYRYRYVHNPVTELDTKLSNNHTNKLRDFNKDVKAASKFRGSVTTVDGITSVYDAAGNLVRAFVRPEKRPLSDLLGNRLAGIAKPKRIRTRRATGDSTISGPASSNISNSQQPVGGTAGAPMTPIQEEEEDIMAAIQEDLEHTMAAIQEDVEHAMAAIQEDEEGFMATIQGKEEGAVGEVEKDDGYEALEGPNGLSTPSPDAVNKETGEITDGNGNVVKRLERLEKRKLSDVVGPELAQYAKPKRQRPSKGKNKAVAPNNTATTLPEGTQADIQHPYHSPAPELSGFHHHGNQMGGPAGVGSAATSDVFHAYHSPQSPAPKPDAFHHHGAQMGGPAGVGSAATNNLFHAHHSPASEVDGFHHYGAEVSGQAGFGSATTNDSSLGAHHYPVPEVNAFHYHGAEVGGSAGVESSAANNSFFNADHSLGPELDGFHHLGDQVGGLAGVGSATNDVSQAYHSPVSELDGFQHHDVHMGVHAGAGSLVTNDLLDAFHHHGGQMGADAGTGSASTDDWFLDEFHHYGAQTGAEAGTGSASTDDLDAFHHHGAQTGGQAGVGSSNTNQHTQDEADGA